MAVIAGFISCNTALNEEGILHKKVSHFAEYATSLKNCLSSSSDSIESCIQNIPILDSIPDVLRNIWVKYGEVNILVSNGQNLEAIERINKILSETEYPNLLFERAQLFTLRATLYKDLQKNLLAGEDYYQAANIYSQLGLDSYAASSYLDIANIHYNTGNYLLSIENSQLSQEYLFKNGLQSFSDSLLLMHLDNTMGLGYFKYNNLDSSLYYYHQSNRLAKSLNQEFWEALTLGNIGGIYQKRGLYKEAIDYFKYDMIKSLENKESNSAAYSIMNIAEIFLMQNQLDSARFYCDSAYALIENSLMSTPLSKYYEKMSEYYQLKHQDDSALFAFKKYIELRDSVQSLEVNTQLQQIQNQKRFERQLVDFNLLKAENELKKQELMISYMSIITVFVILLLVSGLLLTIRKKNRQLREMNLSLESEVMVRTSRLRIINKELDTYLYRASHDVRRPILTILGLLQVAEMTNEAERGEIRSAIRKTANEMDKMLKKLRMAYFLEKQKNRVRAEIDIKALLSDIITELSKDQESCLFELADNGEYIIESNKELLEVIFHNLLENACVFSNGSSKIVHVTISAREKDLVVVIKDHGIGLTLSQMDEMYEPYVRFSNLSHGSGIGLHLVKSAARKLGVQLKVKSKPGEGTEFEVFIPTVRRWKKI